MRNGAFFAFVLLAPHQQVLLIYLLLSKCERTHERMGRKVFARAGSEVVNRKLDDEDEATGTQTQGQAV